MNRGIGLAALGEVELPSEDRSAGLRPQRQQQQRGEELRLQQQPAAKALGGSVSKNNKGTAEETPQKRKQQQRQKGKGVAIAAATSSASVKRNER